MDDDVDVVVVVVVGTGHVHAALQGTPPGHGPRSHCSPLGGSTTPSPHRLTSATNGTRSFDRLAISVPARFVHVVSRLPLSFTLPRSPAHECQTALTAVPRAVAFSFARTGSQMFPTEISGPMTTAWTGTLESALTSAFAVR